MHRFTWNGEAMIPHRAIAAKTFVKGRA